MPIFHAPADRGRQQGRFAYAHKGIYQVILLYTGHYIEVKIAKLPRVESLQTILDNCFAIDNGDIIISWPGSGICVIMEKDDIFSHGIIYCPKDEKDFFAIEPVTNCNNAFNMAEQGIDETGTIYIEPGAGIEGTVKIKIEDTDC